MSCQQGASRASQAASAKLMRFAATLQLEPKHRHALVQTAIARNMAVGNYGCADFVHRRMIGFACINQPVHFGLKLLFCPLPHNLQDSHEMQVS